MELKIQRSTGNNSGRITRCWALSLSVTRIAYIGTVHLCGIHGVSKHLNHNKWSSENGENNTYTTAWRTLKRSVDRTVKISQKFHSILRHAESAKLDVWERSKKFIVIIFVFAEIAEFDTRAIGIGLVLYYVTGLHCVCSWIYLWTHCELA